MEGERVSEELELLQVALFLRGRMVKEKEQCKIKARSSGVWGLVMGAE